MQIEYDEQIVPPPTNYQHQAGFVPPVVSAPSYVSANIRNSLANANHLRTASHNNNIGKHLSDDDDEQTDEEMMAEDSEDYNQDSCDGSVISQNNDSNNNSNGAPTNLNCDKSTPAVKTRATSGRKPTRNEKVSSSSSLSC